MSAGGAAGAPPLRVLQVIDLLRPGVGVPETLRMMVEPARARGVEFTVAALHREPGDLGEELGRAGVPVHDLDFKLWRGARRVAAIARIARNDRIAVVHANEARAIELALKARRLVPSLRVVGHLRVTGNVRSGSGRRERWLARNAPKLFEMVAVAQAVLSDFRDATGLKDGGRVILNGRPLERFLAPLPPAERARQRAELGVPDGTALLLCAATLQPSKDTRRCCARWRSWRRASGRSSCCSRATDPTGRRSRSRRARSVSASACASSAGATTCPT